MDKKDIETKLIEAQKEQARLQTEVARARTVVTNVETLLIKQIGKVESFQELLPAKEPAK